MSSLFEETSDLDSEPEIQNFMTVSADSNYPAFVLAPSFFSKAECHAVLDQSEKAHPAIIGESAEIVREVRSCAVAWIRRDDGSDWIYERLWRLAQQVNEDYFGFELEGFDDSLQLIVYDAGDHHNWHQDIGSAAFLRRKLSLSVNISYAHEYRGGNLVFWSEAKDAVAIDCRRQQGTATLFPAYQMHRVTPVEMGKRISLVAWISGPRWR